MCVISELGFDEKNVVSKNYRPVISLFLEENTPKVWNTYQVNHKTEMYI